MLNAFKLLPAARQLLLHLYQPVFSELLTDEVEKLVADEIAFKKNLSEAAVARHALYESDCAWISDVVVGEV